MNLFLECVLDVSDGMPKKQLLEGYRIKMINDAISAHEYVLSGKMKDFHLFMLLCQKYDCEVEETLNAYNVIRNDNKTNS